MTSNSATVKSATPNQRLAGRVALVTGASGGIGRAVASRLVSEGASVTAIGRDKDRLESLLRAVDGSRINLRQVDLTDDRSRCALVTELSSGPRVDLLVLSAGVYSRGGHNDAPLQSLDDLLATNVRAPYALIQALLPSLRAGGGDLVVVNSSQGIRASGGLGQYAATQHAMRAITDSLRQEVNGDGVRVCIIHTGRVATPMQEKIFRDEGRPYRADLLLQPDDIATVVMTVLSLPDEAEITEIHLRPAKKTY
jgi:NADP-dependent 3-hydroxy acid dehydrogenase YdfG